MAGPNKIRQRCLAALMLASVVPGIQAAEDLPL